MSFTLTPDKYSKINQTFDMSHVINVLLIKYVETIGTGKHTRKVEHDHVYEDAASIAKYGRFKRVVTVHKRPNFQDYADAVFAKNADPEPVPSSVVIPIRAASELLPGYEDNFWVGKRTEVVLPDGVTTYTCRIARIEHRITNDKWLVEVFLRNQDLIQRPRRDRHAVVTEVAHNPDATILTAHLDDAAVTTEKIGAEAVDGGKLAPAIDGTGKTVTGATLRTKSTGNRIVVRDDSSEGTIEFYSGKAGETRGAINPGVTLGQHLISFATSKDASGTYGEAGIMTLFGSAPDAPNGALNVGGQLFCNDEFRANNDVHGTRLISDAPDTVTFAANLWMSSFGVINKTSSLSKHKLDQRAVDLEAVRGLLDLVPKTWVDRAEAEAAGRTEGLRRVPGLIAEDVAAHAPALATYDHEGNLEGVAYDRLAPLLLPIIRAQQDAIADLTARVEALEGRKHS